MNVQLVMELLSLALSLANAVVPKNGPGMNYTAVSGTLMLIVEKANQIYQQHMGEPMDLTLIQGEKPV